VILIATGKYILIFITFSQRSRPMAKRTPASQSKHDHMVTSLVKLLVKDGYSDIHATHLGAFEDPAKVPGRDGKLYMCDVVARNNGIDHIFEVETMETITLDFTKEQFKAFYDHAKKNEGVFNILVPNNVESDAVMVLRELGMEEIKVWTM
jgi:Holliday junction resolvase